MPDSFSQEDLEQYITAIVDGDTEVIEYFKNNEEVPEGGKTKWQNTEAE